MRKLSTWRDRWYAAKAPPFFAWGQCACRPRCAGGGARQSAWMSRVRTPRSPPSTRCTLTSACARTCRNSPVLPLPLCAPSLPHSPILRTHTSDDGVLVSWSCPSRQEDLIIDDEHLLEELAPLKEALERAVHRKNEATSLKEQFEDEVCWRGCRSANELPSSLQALSLHPFLLTASHQQCGAPMWRTSLNVMP